jgi:uncharacterized membrane protein HdeD (DUF308 family)
LRLAIAGYCQQAEANRVIERGSRMEASVEPQAREAIRGFSRLWWLWIVFGIFWVVIGLVILQFDQASITTVGILVGAMFLASGFQQFMIMAMVDRGGWLYGLFGVLFLIAGVIALISPENTFAALADILGFLFLLVGIFWIIQAFVSREINELWWLGLLSGILMVILAFWTGGQFFIEKAYVLLVFAGIWALLQGVSDVVRAFQIRKLGEMV